MRNKNTWVNFGIGVGAYLLLILLVRQNVELFSYTPELLVLGTLAMYMIIGFMQRHGDKRAGRIAVILPYGVGVTMYAVARILKSADLMALFKKIVPQIYQPLNKISILMDQEISRDIIVAVLMMGFVVVSMLTLEIGRSMAASESSVMKFCYNIVLVWGVHFYLFMGAYAFAAMNPAFMSDIKMKNLFAVGMTLAIFLVYFLVGRACRNISLQIVQFLSCISISVSAMIMYVLGMLFIWDIGIYERYILPVATSFIGVMCKEIGQATGETAKVISQYGITASLIMSIVPSVLIFVGKLASMLEEDIQANEEVKNEIKVENK